MIRTAFAAVLCLATAVPAAAQVTRISVSTAGAEANRRSVAPSISADGRYVVFTSRATNLVAGDTNGFADIFLRDCDTDGDGVFDEIGAVATTRLSAGVGGAEPSNSSGLPKITPDGRYVVFSSYATNLVAGFGSTIMEQVYRLDCTTSTTVLVSATPSGSRGDTPATSPAVSADGTIVAFLSFGESGLVSGASDGPHVYVRNVAQATTAAAYPSRRAGSPSRQPTGSFETWRSPRTARAWRIWRCSGRNSSLSRCSTRRWSSISSSGASMQVAAPLDTRSFGLNASATTAVLAISGNVLREVVASGAASAPLDAPCGSCGLLGTSPSARYAVTAGKLHDFDLGQSRPLAFVKYGPARPSTATIGGSRWPRSRLWAVSTATASATSTC